MSKPCRNLIHTGWSLDQSTSQLRRLEMWLLSKWKHASQKQTTMKCSVSKEKHVRTYLFVQAIGSTMTQLFRRILQQIKSMPRIASLPLFPPKNLPVYHRMQQYRVICQETRDWEEGGKEANIQFQGYPKGTNLFLFLLLLLVQTLIFLVLSPHPANYRQRKDSHTLSGNVVFSDVVRSWFWRHVFVSCWHDGPTRPTCQRHHVMSGSFFLRCMSCRYLIADMSWIA